MLTLPSDIDWQWFLPRLRALAAPRSVPRPLTWREHLGMGLVLLANKIVGFADEESFARARAAIIKSETDVGSNRVERGVPGTFSGFDFFIGKTSGTIAKGATNGTVTIWDSATDATAVAATTATLTNVWNPFADVGATKYVLVIQLGFTYMLCAAEC